MKAALRILLLVVVLGLIGGAAWQAVDNQRAGQSHQYPATVQASLAADCRDSGGRESLCGCAIERIQRSYTFGAYQALSGPQRQAVATSFVRDCTAESHDYGPQFVARFHQDCEGGDVAASQCTCFLQRIQARFTFAEYQAIEQQALRTGDAPAALQEALAPCTT